MTNETRKRPFQKERGSFPAPYWEEEDLSLTGTVYFHTEKKTEKHGSRKTEGGNPPRVVHSLQIAKVWLSWWISGKRERDPPVNTKTTPPCQGRGEEEKKPGMGGDVLSPTQKKERRTYLFCKRKGRGLFN